MAEPLRLDAAALSAAAAATAPAAGGDEPRSTVNWPGTMTEMTPPYEQRHLESSLKAG
jgi:hypothetical protein